MSEHEKSENPEFIGALDTGRRIEVTSLKSAQVKTVRRHDLEKDALNTEKPVAEHVPLQAESSNGSHDKSKPAHNGHHRNGHGEGTNGHRNGEQRLHKKPQHKAGAHGRPTKKLVAEKAPGFVEPAEHVRRGSQPVTQKPVEPARMFERPMPTEFDDSGDFAAMLDAFGPIKRETIDVGQKVKGRVLQISGDSVFVALGQRLEGVLSVAEYKDAQGELVVAVGDTLEAYVVSLDHGIRLSKKLGQHEVDFGMLEDAQKSGMPVEGKITGVNKGGLDVSIAGTKAFCPIGQVGLGFIEDASSMVGSTQHFLVTQISEGGRNIVVSRKALLERERQQKTKERLKTLQVGDVVKGNISRVMDFGAFVDLQGVEGLIPVSELSHSHLVSVHDVVKVGDSVEVEVLRIEPDPKRPEQMRIGLSLKAALPDPIETHGMHIYAGTTLPGKVVRLQAFGAFVELFPGIDGLVHISELSPKRIRHPEEVVKVGDMVTVRVLDVDFANRRISLSLLPEGTEKESAYAGAKDRHKNEEQADPSVGQYLSSMNQKKSLGTFADLLKK